jgi:hypothetical protein
MVKLSTGLAVSMLGNYGLTAMMNYGFINVYTGVQPLSPDMPPEGTLLARVTTDGDAFIVGSTAGGSLQLQQDAAGILTPFGDWILTGLADGEAGWWRWQWNQFDDQTQSFYYPRMDGTVGESLLLVDTAITTATVTEIDAFIVQFRGS